MLPPDYACALLSDGSVEIFNRHNNGHPHILLTRKQVHKFLQWYLDGICPVCHVAINEGEVICDDCFAKAQRFPARADNLAAEVAGQ